MDEWLPAVLGCTWGLLAAPRCRPSSPAILAVGVLAIGVLVPLVNGELATSAWFAVVDTASAAAGAAVGIVARLLTGAPLARPAPDRRSG